MKKWGLTKEPAMHCFVHDHKEVNQNTALCPPGGWGRTMFEALSEGVPATYGFPCEGLDARSAKA